MDFTYLLKGVIIGFAISIPIGPVGILCIRRTIAYGKLHGFLTGLSSAFSDMFFSIVAAFGITFISNFISGHQQAIRLLGGAVLTAFGYYTFRPHQIKETVIQRLTTPVLSFFSTFLVTFTNPMVVFAYAAVFAGIGANDLVHHQTSAAFIVAGVFTGSLLWFSLLTYLSTMFKEKIISYGLFLVNKIAGSLLMLFGMVALWSGVSGF